jgi:hypothetical protein
LISNSPSSQTPFAKSQHAPSGALHGAAQHGVSFAQTRSAPWQLACSTSSRQDPVRVLQHAPVGNRGSTAPPEGHRLGIAAPFHSSNPDPIIKLMAIKMCIE